jgi:hypothetical protein
MKKQTRLVIKEPDVFGILSATWILACNDETEMITYEGIKHRLNLQDDFDIKGLIQCRGELFRKGLPRYRLKEWKEAMLGGRRRPSWILDIEDPSIQRQRIEALTADDIFRSQFRAEKDAPRSPIEIIDWGLQHIDRLRKASLEAREESIKRWQLWAVLIRRYYE